MKIAITTGGESGERAVSLKSADFVESAIDFAETSRFIFPEDREKFIQQANIFDLAIPVGHGEGIEDGSLQGFLKHLAIPFIFSDVAAHAIAMDKQFTKEIVSQLGIKTTVTSSNWPLFAKPRSGGSSVASKYCETPTDLEELQAENPGLEFITETPVRGREFTVGVAQWRGETVSLPVIEVISQGEFFDYESKYNPDKLAKEICPADINQSLTEELQRQALLIHKHIGVRHLSRSDFIITADGEIYFLEINTIPGLTATSLIPKMFTAAGLKFKELLKDWCEEVVCSN